MYMCIYVYTCKNMYIHVYTCEYMCIFVYICEYMYTNVEICHSAVSIFIHVFVLLFLTMVFSADLAGALRPHTCTVQDKK